LGKNGSNYHLESLFRGIGNGEISGVITFGVSEMRETSQRPPALTAIDPEKPLIEITQEPFFDLALPSRTE
jgi:hypothetical protein